MNKNFKIYLIIWAIGLVIFNMMTFISPIRMNIMSGNFGVGYTFIVFAFLGHLLCSYIVFKERNTQKMFYNTSLVLISFISFFTIAGLGICCMTTPVIPMSIGMVICMSVTGIFAILVLVTKSVINVVSSIDEETRTKTYTMKSLTSSAEHLMATVNLTELKEVCEKVYNSFKYSDIVSNLSVMDINEQIQRSFKDFENAVNEQDIELANDISKEIISLVDKRNKQCKLVK